MSRVVLYRCPECSALSRASGEYCEHGDGEPVEYVHADVARGLVEALRLARTKLPQISSLPNGETEIGKIAKTVDAALATAEEALK